LPAEIRSGKFREDLFYRLRVVTIELPPLRSHKLDISVLSDAFLKMHGARMGLSTRLNKDVLAALEAYDWPGNVRELKNALERGMVMCRANWIALPNWKVTRQALTAKRRTWDDAWRASDFAKASASLKLRGLRRAGFRIAGTCCGPRRRLTAPAKLAGKTRRHSAPAGNR
jgi:DNA-binding NtrC family response regulator